VLLLLLLLLLAVVSDAGSGGQVLLDSTSFGLVKDRLEELGQVRLRTWTDVLCADMMYACVHARPLIHASTKPTK
jgi:hypothetical protein